MTAYEKCLDFSGKHKQDQSIAFGWHSFSHYCKSLIYLARKRFPGSFPAQEFDLYYSPRVRATLYKQQHQVVQSFLDCATSAQEGRL